MYMNTGHQSVSQFTSLHRTPSASSNVVPSYKLQYVPCNRMIEVVPDFPHKTSPKLAYYYCTSLCTALCNQSPVYSYQGKPSTRINSHTSLMNYSTLHPVAYTHLLQKSYTPPSWVERHSSTDRLHSSRKSVA
jgi:hypothetical protein